MANRTTADLWFVLVPYGLVAFSAFTLWRELNTGRWGHAVFAGVNATLTLYAIVAFIGLRHSVVDVATNVVQRLYRTEQSRPGAATDAEPATPEWARMLHYGSADLAGDPDSHEREVLRMRDTRSGPRLEATTTNVDVAATVYTSLDNLAVGENITVYRDADGFRAARSGRPIPTVPAAEVGLSDLVHPDVDLDGAFGDVGDVDPVGDGANVA